MWPGWAESSSIHDYRDHLSAQHPRAQRRPVAAESRSQTGRGRPETTGTFVGLALHTMDGADCHALTDIEQRLAGLHPNRAVMIA